MNAPQKTAAATAIKNRFGDFLEDVLRSHEPLIIERHGKPVAVLVDYYDWARDRKTEKRSNKTPWTDACKKLAADIRKNKNFKKQTSAVELIRSIREEEYDASR